MRFVLYYIGIFYFLCVFVTLSLLVWTLSTVSKSLDETPIVFLPKVQNELKTGDLVLFRHQKYNIPWLKGADRIMSHMGVIWQHPEWGPLLIDMNPTKYGAFPDPLPFDVLFEGPSVSVIRFSDAVIFYPGSIFLRCLKTPLQFEEEQKFIQKLLTWGIHLEYDESIAKRDWIVWFALALSPLVPELSDIIMNFTHLTLPRTASFCTEMIAELFRACHVLPKYHVSHIWGPIAWMHGIGAGAGLRDQLWESEVQVLNR